MRLQSLALVTLAIAALGGCTCADTVDQNRFACEQTTDCLGGSVCRGGECRTDSIPPGTCFAGETKACAVTGCASACGADAGWLACTPVTGGGFETNAQHCGACGNACSTRLVGFQCVAARCTCVLDADCPPGNVCGPGGVCVLETDACAKRGCDAGTVCRDGACAAVGCGEGCKLGEVCNTVTNACRPILSCRYAVACADGGLCEGGPMPDGEPCDDGVGCTFTDQCVGGACRGTAYTCPAPTQCQQAVACSGDGGCEVLNAPDGTACDDGQACTAGDACLSGQCAGSPYTCTPDQCSASSVCAGDGGCLSTPKTVGAACDDNQPCTFNDSCRGGGICAGLAYSCPGVTQCKEAGVCLGDGGCDTVNKPDGTGCDDGNGCTLNDSCSGGTCAGTPPTSYRDLDGDGLGTASVTQVRCPVSAGYVLDAGDCDDTSANVRTIVPAAPDLDQDGYTQTTMLDPAACVGSATNIAGRTYYRSATGAFTWLAFASDAGDCNDSNSNVYLNRAVAIDADRDGFTTTTTTTTRCTGDAGASSGRTYYADADGGLTLLGGASTSIDCDDANATLFPRTYYPDLDGDGFGATTGGAVQCPQQTGFVTSNTDCNDTSSLVYRNITGLYLDNDQDGYSNSAASTVCVGATTSAGGRTYYRSSGGQFIHTPTLLGPDCAEGNSSLFTTQTNVVIDNDRDGYPATVTEVPSVCAGATTTQGTRSYFAAGDGGFFMPRADCIQRQGSSCSSSFVDCYDQNGSAAFGQTAFFTSNRGDGNFDYDCSGTVTASTTGTYCAATVPGALTYTDGGCSMASTLLTLCTTAAFSLPGACGRPLAGGSVFVLDGTMSCVTATQALTTTVGCR
jgi:hypothetical protein